MCVLFMQKRMMITNQYELQLDIVSIAKKFLIY